MASALAAGSAHADRVVLGPGGEPLRPSTEQAVFIIRPDHGNANYSWLTFSSPVGIETELERLDSPREARKRYSLNIDYPAIPDTNGFPAIAVGVRDLLGTGVEHGAIYLTASRPVALSDRQARWFRSVRLSAGYGTGQLDGAFGGAELVLRDRVRFGFEVYRQRTNFSVSIPLVRNTQARAYSLDGTPFFGLSYSLTR